MQRECKLRKLEVQYLKLVSFYFYFHNTLPWELLEFYTPYTLVSSPFKNWRGMAESDGRRVDKRIWIDVTTVTVCTDEFLADLRASMPLLKDYVVQGKETTNSQLYRAYIRLYLHSHPIVAQNLDIIVAQREQTEYGLPIEVYFFLTDKVWDKFETIQSDIFDHLISMAPRFNLHLYQAEGWGVNYR